VTPYLLIPLDPDSLTLFFCRHARMPDARASAFPLFATVPRLLIRSNETRNPVGGLAHFEIMPPTSTDRISRFSPNSVLRDAGTPDFPGLRKEF
jgi:hypothetical protein